MIIGKRNPNNPLLSPRPSSCWEGEASFNGCPIKHEGATYLFYRALSPQIHYDNVDMKLSIIGKAVSRDGVKFEERQQFITPEHDWEKFGCEDPRITKLDGKFYIFYTAISNFPFVPKGIKVAVAITKDLKHIEKKRLVTPFNSKAMSLFPERINGKIWGILTVDTDIPPSKVCLVSFEKESDMWDEKFWDKWESEINDYALPLQKRPNDQVEAGAPPIKTKKGWLVLYSYIKNYFSPNPSFGIETVLLDLKDPTKIIGRGKSSLLSPEEDYEVRGEVSNVVFPSGALLKKKNLELYYGAADSHCCSVSYDLDKVIKDALSPSVKPLKFQRIPGGPILEPIKENSWESKAVFNPGVIKLKNKIHIIYRTTSSDETSYLGYASTVDGVNIKERLNEPIYLPREDFELKKKGTGASGCEDPRLTKIGDKIYMLYTAFDGVNPPQVAMTHIKEKDFLSKNWNWAKPILISPPGIDDKDACILEEKFKGQYVVYHRVEGSIDVCLVEDLDFKDRNVLKNTNLIRPRKGRWDGEKVGLNIPPIKTKKGWIMIYHGVSKGDMVYRLGAVLMDLSDPTTIKSRIDYPVFEPVKEFEKKGIVPNVVFPCGGAVIKDNFYIYYGGADKATGVAVISLKKLLKQFK